MVMLKGYALLPTLSDIVGGVLCLEEADSTAVSCVCTFGLACCFV